MLPFPPVMTVRPTTLDARYRAVLAARGFAPDPAQERALHDLQRVASGLAHPPRPALASRLRGLLPGAAPAALTPVRGAWLWGDVWRGKTFLMDVFFDSLPFPERLRYHFHRIMYRVHGQLRELRDHPDPLARVADDLARQARVLCFDEFFVSDIADAMILGNLLRALFARGVTLVATSNMPPGDLYRDGLQRQRFLPAIDLLREHAEVIHVDGPTDYRLRVLERAEIYHAPADEAAERNLDGWFTELAPNAGGEQRPLEINGRTIRLLRRGDGIAWFDFADLCDGPRSQDDYIEIARAFQTVIVSRLPQLTEERENAARRFIALVDEFYERRVKLICSAAVPVAELYAGARLTREFTRTRSRLLEMQSRDYLAAPHIP
jgi:cell division protein ZapE